MIDYAAKIGKLMNNVTKSQYEINLALEMICVNYKQKRCNLLKRLHLFYNLSTI
jgi:hypothetical protein